MLEQRGEEEKRVTLRRELPSDQSFRATLRLKTEPGIERCCCSLCLGPACTSQVKSHVSL